MPERKSCSYCDSTSAFGHRCTWASVIVTSIPSYLNASSEQPAPKTSLLSSTGVMAIEPDVSFFSYEHISMYVIAITERAPSYQSASGESASGATSFSTSTERT